MERVNPLRQTWEFCGQPMGIVGLGLFVTGLLILNALNIVVLEGAYSISDHFSNLGIPSSYYEKSWWLYLLPQPEVYGTWASTTVVFAALVQQFLHPATVLVISQSVLVVTVFIVGLRLTGSFVFAASAALLCVTMPFNFHVYSVHGTTAHGLLMSYFLLFVDASIGVLKENRSRRSFAYLLIATILLVLGYETWIDVAVVIFALALPIGIILHATGKKMLLRAFSIYVLSIAALTASYVVLKIGLGFGSGAGTETDLVFFYGWLPAIWDDYITKIIAFSFTAFSLVLPPDLVSSMSLVRAGPDWIVDQQHGYHPQMQFLTYLNHIFIWRFYAGMTFVALLMLGVSSWRKLFEHTSSWRLWIVLICVAMVLVGASTHSLVKFRPMHSMPYLGYQVWVNVIGVVGLCAVLVDWLSNRSARASLFVVAGVWSYFIWVGYSVRTAQGVYVTNMAMGTYPDPILNLLRGIKTLF